MSRDDEEGRFIETWGSLGVLWGINRSMARVHALLLITEKPLDSEDIAGALTISRGNVSMCLKELRNWGVVQRVNVAGDRRDFYVAEQDSWRMLYRIALGRKAREFDPALNALRHLLAEGETENDPRAHERLTQLEGILSAFESAMGSFLASEQASRSLVEFLAKFSRS